MTRSDAAIRSRLCRTAISTAVSNLTTNAAQPSPKGIDGIVDAGFRQVPIDVIDRGEPFGQDGWGLRRSNDNRQEVGTRLVQPSLDRIFSISVNPRSPHPSR